jgi:hypothetical protein
LAEISSTDLIAAMPRYDSGSASRRVKTEPKTETLSNRLKTVSDAG